MVVGSVGRVNVIIMKRATIRQQIAKLQAMLRGTENGRGRPPRGRNDAALFLLLKGPQTTQAISKHCEIVSAYKTLSYHSEWFERTEHKRWSLTQYGREKAEELKEGGS